ncbi:MAG: hypothetical protein CME15_04095 [Gemmatimonadetes bacterium]|jgi:uncharacterized repeat protein (TIGR04138 family)|nr:hypothetical protein [Gemmatimonadota bacterium]MEC7842020.1 Minf_1886 family protein [Candidatus Latescibacterota bacterium]
MEEEFLREIDELAEQRNRYAKPAYLFIYAALQHTVEKMGKIDLPREQRHVSGGELLRGISNYALSQFGPLTHEVFKRWGINETRDFGEIVFQLVNANLMSKTEDDNIDDFTDVYDFAEELDWKKRRAEFKQQS